MRRGDVAGWRVHGFGGREIDFDFACAAGELPAVERRIADCLGYEPSAPAATA